MFLALSFLILLRLPDDPPPRWMPLANPGCSARLPNANPKVQKLEDTGPDDKPVKISIYRGTIGKTSYLVTISEFSDEYMKQPVKIIFDNARNGSIARSGGKLVSEKDIELDKVPGRETIVTVKDAGFVKARVYVHNERQYAVMIASPNEKELDDENAKKFFESFKLKTMRRPGK
ncbi:MAG: hypothetical protein QM703_11900 [Gemmatales bacterium]